MKICNVAFCGTGKWVMTYHVPNFQKLSDRYRIVGFYDCFEEKAREAAAQTGAKWLLKYAMVLTSATHPDSEFATEATKKYVR